MINPGHAINAGFHLTECKKWVRVETSVNIRDEFFYMFCDGTIEIFNTDSYVSKLEEKKLDFNQKNIDYFEINYVFPMSETALIGVKRFEPNSIYLFDKETNELFFERKKIKKLSHLLDNARFDDIFRSLLKDKLLNYNEDEVAVLFSGGVDSIYIVVSLLQLNIKPVLFTAIPQPAFDSSYIDQIRSKACGNIFGLKHIFVDVELSQNKLFSFWDKLRRRIPMAVHTGIFFEELIKKCKDSGIKCVIAGQNADTFYNFGPTSKLSCDVSSMADTFRRFYLTNFIINGIQVKKGDICSAAHRILVRLLLNIGAFIYQVLKRDGSKYRAPRSLEEAYHVYVNRPDYTIFPSVDDDLIDDTCNYDFYGELMRYKIHNFLTSGAPMIIHNTALKYGLASLTPFSEIEMLEAFNTLDRTLADVLKPKRYIYESIDLHYPGLLNKVEKLPKKGNLPNYHEWINKNMDFFSEGKKNLKFSSATRFMRGLSKFWLQY